MAFHPCQYNELHSCRGSSVIVAVQCMHDDPYLELASKASQPVQRKCSIHQVLLRTLTTGWRGGHGGGGGGVEQGEREGMVVWGHTTLTISSAGLTAAETQVPKELYGAKSTAVICSQFHPHAKNSLYGVWSIMLTGIWTTILDCHFVALLPPLPSICDV